MRPSLPEPSLPGRNAALFLDLDGTLVPFAREPSLVVVPDDIKHLLSQLHDLLDGALGIVSGRSIEQIDALLRVPNLAAAGLHGVEWRDVDGQVTRMPVPPELVEAALGHARHRLGEHEGVLIEDKGAALALHFRNRPQARPEVEEVAFDLLRIVGAGFVLQHGQQVVELKPAGIDKGTAMDRLLEAPPFTGREPWFVGDDQTDEFAFERTNAIGGVSIVVGKRRPTVATAALASPNAVRRWLRRARTHLDSSEGESRE